MYRVFISHAHQGHDNLYNKLASRLDEKKAEGEFDWYDMSVPHRKRFAPDGEQLPKAELKQLLRPKIEGSDVIIAFAKPIVARRQWLKWEINVAKSLGKPIIAVWQPSDASTSKYVRDRADRKIGTGRIDSIVNAIVDVVKEASARKAEATRELEPEEISDDDVEIVNSPSDVEPNGNITDALARLDELVQSDELTNHSVLETPKEVLSLPIAEPSEPAIPVAEALEQLGKAPSALAADERPKDVVPLPAPVAPPPPGLRWRWSSDFA